MIKNKGNIFSINFASELAAVIITQLDNELIFALLYVEFPHGLYIDLSEIERFSYDLEMKAREQNRNDERMEIERFDWFIERKDKRVWLFIG